ncbi:type III pantothenate kinase [Tenacibaculum piscium]|uniref:Type III pantothenate kinase n=2 Tax=Tenacibaculum piscium TaxID=1458515 RepID=A0A2H1YII6_9FLAO|nr:type III pantothenate kinase [Tenacibaculum piscium]MBE7628536.1 type III pantothenate kinase [Tenacibaculum piscium]MBE7669677.1 type III pantothenate kinase [Tenacibaculum piscium]MBE7684735.1 type III pantothenate kinase [Tenacibaculum piscium]MBE7689355.1 type III pantothenate kinase [Tenacibaculum piscium]MCG8182753.1 type III pantothenate kinase [Tenacibaculum piscium]
MNLSIDIGNTRAKLAVFQDDNIIDFIAFDTSELIKIIKKIISKYTISASIIASVATISEKISEELKKLLNPIYVTNQTKVPFINRYGTPKTLGVDRIALAAAAVKNYPKKNVLVIDAGTCITFDFINHKKEYLGGAISLGIEMRYKALHTFTAKLPLLEPKEVDDFIGFNTNTSIHSGVVNGVCQEINGVINQYKKKYPDLTVVLTGGNTFFLAKQLKSGIFANPNFVLEGLHTVLTHNLTND